MKGKSQAPPSSNTPKDSEKLSGSRGFHAPHNPFFDSISKDDGPIQFYTGTGQLIQPDPERSVVKVEDEDKEEHHLDPRRNNWVHPGLQGLTVDYKLQDAKPDTAIVEVPWYLQEHLEHIKGDPQRLARHVNSEKELSGVLASAHSYAANDNELKVPVGWMAGSVVGGRFTSKRDQRGIVSQEGESLAQLKKSVSQFYEVTDYLRKRYQEPLQAAKVNSITVYRAVATGNRDQDVFVESLPSSTGLSLDFVKRWTQNRGKENYLIFEISVPVTHNMISMAYPEDYALQYPQPKNQDQAEVTLAPTTLTKTGMREEDGFTIVEVSANMISKGDALKNIQAQSDHRGEDLSVDDIAPVFAGIKRFFSLDTLARKYDYNWAEWAPKITETVSGSANNQTVTFSHSDYDQEFKVQLRMDQDSGAICIEINTWEEDFSYDSDDDSSAAPADIYESKATQTKYKAEKMAINFTKKTIGNIFYVGIAGNLDQADEFETLVFPEMWNEALEDA